jgi:hypothetical protein
VNSNAAIELLRLVRHAAQGDPYAEGLLFEMARLYRAAGEPVPVLLQGYVPEETDEL